MGSSVKGLRVAAALAAALTLIAACGCDQGSSGPTAAEKQAYAKMTGVDETRAAKFVKALEAVPAADRRDYLNSHPEDMRNMAMVQDAELQEKFRKLVLNRP